MPDDIAAEACHDGGRGEAQAMNKKRSAWMAHWMKSSYKSASPACNRFGGDCELKEEKEDSGAEQHGLVGGIDSSMHAGAVREAVRATSVTFNSEADNEKAKKACFDSKSFPTMKFAGKWDGKLPLQREQHAGEDGKSETEPCSGDGTVPLNRGGTSRAGLSSIPAHVPLNIETLVKECQVLSQEVLPTALLMKSPWDVEQQNLTVSTSLWDDFVKSASDAVADGRSKRKTVMPQITHEPFEICQSSYNLAARGRFASTKYHTFSSLLISEKKMNNLLNPQRSFFSRWMQGGFTRLPHDSVPGSGDSLYFVGGKQHEIEKYVSNPNIMCQTESSEADKLQKFCGLNSVVEQIPCSIHDVESMKIYTSIDSVEESSRVRPKISQATHHILMSKNTDVTFSDRGQFFREPIALIKFKGNAFNEILDFSPPTSGHALEALKREGIGSSIKSGGKENVHDFKYPTCLKNESSAETDTMDIDVLHKNDLPGDVSFRKNKRSKDSQNSLTSKVATICSREKTLAKSMNTAIPDINEEPCDLLTEEGPVVDKEASTSRTHSLELDHFLSHADEHVRSNSGNSSLGSDPSSRWVKRLKLGTFGSAHGTESTRIGEALSHEKVNSIFGKITKDSKIRLEPKMIYHAEGQMVPHIPVTVSTNGKSTLTEAKKTVEITLSHPWIQRWSHNRAESSQKRHELGELPEQKSPNAVPEESQKRQFPSIAAMALMGKAMNSLNPSELMKKGPVIVWNMKGF